MSRVRTWSLRRWIGVALGAMLAVPVVALMVTVLALVGPTQGPRDPLAELTDIVRQNASSLDEPAVRDHLRTEAAARDAVIVIEPTDGASWSTGDADAVGERQGYAVMVTDGGTRVRIHTPAEEGPPKELRRWIVPVIGIAAIVLTLVSIIVLVDRRIVRPVEALSAATARVAADDDLGHMPRSTVREIDRLTTSFRQMHSDVVAARHRQRALDDERRMFISAIAHDLRTPLFALRASLQAIASGMGDSPERRGQYVQIAQAKADRLEHLIQEFFEYSKVTFLPFTPERTPIALGELVHEVTQELQPLARERGKRLAVTDASGGAQVDGDAPMLVRAMENVLDNALRHTPEGTAVRVGVSATDQVVRLVIADSGAGFAADTIGRVFEATWRGDSSRGGVGAGAGLGLSIAQRIMHAHDGEISAENGVDGGAVVTMTFPRRSASVQPFGR